MTIPWVQVYSNMVVHNKTRRLATELKITGKDVKPNVIAAGMLVALWTWAAQNATDGDVTGVSPEDLADITGWKRSPKLLYNALVDVGWIDVTEDGVHIHDWLVYSQLLNEQTENRKEKDRARAKAYRDRKKQAAQESQAKQYGEAAMRHGDDCVTITQESQANHAPTKPNHTIPNHISYEDRMKEGNSTSNVQRDDCPIPASESWEEMKARINAARRNGDR